MRRVIVGILCIVMLPVGLGLLLVPRESLGNLQDAAVILYQGPRHPPDQSLEFKTTPTRPLFMHVFRGSAADTPRATVLLFHGGGFHSGWPEELFPHASALAAAGHTTFVAEYRLQRADGVDYVAELEDCRDALDWVARHASDFGADPSRIVLGGSSAGAHLAAAIMTIPRSLDASGAVPSVSPDEQTTLASDAASSVIGLVLSAPYLNSGDASEAFRRAPPTPGLLGRWLMGEPEDVFGGRSAEYNPRAFIHAGMPPAFVAGGALDALWPPAMEFCEAMRSAGVACRAESYPDVGHAFALAGYRHHEAFLADLLVAIEGWL